MRAGARDEYAVPYECQLGANGDGVNNVDTNKSLWVFNEADCPASDAPGLDINVNFAAKDVVKDTTTAAKVAFTSANSASATSTDDSSDTTTAKATPTAAPTTSSDTAAWVAQTTQSVNVYDQATWVCQHPGFVLLLHAIRLAGQLD